MWDKLGMGGERSVSVKKHIKPTPGYIWLQLVTSGLQLATADLLEGGAASEKNSLIQHTTASSGLQGDPTSLGLISWVQGARGCLRQLRETQEAGSCPPKTCLLSRMNSLEAPRVNPAHKFLENIHHWEKCRRDLDQ